MIDSVTHSTQVHCDREALGAELEATRIAFHAFLNALTTDQWRQKGPGGAWTMAEVAEHLTWALEQLPKEVASARQGKGMFNFPKRVADPLSYWMTRWNARNVTPDTIGHRYDAAMTAVVRTLDNVKESEWALGAQFYGHGFYTIADLFHTPADHLAEHAAGR